MIIRILSENTGLNKEYILKVVKSAKYRYKNYYIKKKKKQGKRLISHPAKELKFLQKCLINNIFYHFPIHKSVYSYRKGIGIKDLADIHKKNNFLLRTDFKNFFESIKSKDVSRLIKKNKDKIDHNLSEKDIEIICKLVCKDEKLTIGAPSSPIISNSILYDFDKFWYSKCRELNIAYSRYSDDLYFSTNYSKKLTPIYKELKVYLTRMDSPCLELNRNKTVFTSKKHKRIVTGLMLTSEEEVSVGRKKKRFIRSLMFKYKNGDISNKQLLYLKGYLAYIKAVEPVFLKRLEKKYGNKIVKKILSSNINLNSDNYITMDVFSDDKG